eukprot:g3205.t1
MSAVPKIHPEAYVCEDTVITGNVTIGKGTVVHPKCVIRADKGAIVIGENNILEERVRIESSKEATNMRIGKFNVFEVGCKVSDSDVDHFNLFEVECIIPKGIKIETNCVIGTRVELDPTVTKVVKSNTVFFRVGSDPRASTHRNMSRVQVPENAIEHREIVKRHIHCLTDPKSRSFIGRTNKLRK